MWNFSRRKLHAAALVHQIPMYDPSGSQGEEAILWYLPNGTAHRSFQPLEPTTGREPGRIRICWRRGYSRVEGFVGEHGAAADAAVVEAADLDALRGAGVVAVVGRRASSSTGSMAPVRPFTCGAHDSYVPANPAIRLGNIFHPWC